jgi:cyclopropane-fatty-acyl-phospholipid synthase
VTAIQTAMRSAGFEVRDVESLREHYALTLRRWATNLEADRRKAVALVGPERERAWRLYLLVSEVGFKDGEISVYQVLGARQGGDHRLPLTRADLLAPIETNHEEVASAS